MLEDNLVLHVHFYIAMKLGACITKKSIKRKGETRNRETQRVNSLLVDSIIKVNLNKLRADRTCRELWNSS